MFLKCVQNSGGGTPSNSLVLNTTLSSAQDKIICNLNSSSSGTLRMDTDDNYYSIWTVNGVSVTKTRGTASAVVYKVENGVLKLSYPSTAGGVLTFSGFVDNISPNSDSTLTQTIGLH